MSAAELVVMGGSLGACDAVITIPSALAPDPGPAVVLVLHRAAGTGFSLADALSRSTGCPVQEVTDGLEAQPGRIYVAPADYHVLVDRRHLSLSLDARQSHARPSIDVLFTSAAEVHRSRLVGCCSPHPPPTGSTAWPASGTTIVQSPETARSPVAALAAVARGVAAHVLPLGTIANRLRRLASAVR